MVGITCKYTEYKVMQMWCTTRMNFAWRHATNVSDSLSRFTLKDIFVAFRESDMTVKAWRWKMLLNFILGSWKYTSWRG